MSVRINLEIGHEAAIRTKRTQEGFTHDWEVFVRGCDNANIHYYVEKVVFYLHETFQKPKRVIKEPPYSVKESGYAGFTLPIEIHLRNKDDPKKISFNYDLNLQQSGPAIIKVQKEKYVFNNPGEDFKLKLLKGGGIMVNSLSSSQDITRENRPILDEKSQLVSKPRLGGSEFVKKPKPKPEEPHISSFQALFGPPITKTSKTSLDPKSLSKDKNSNINKSGSGDKEKLKSKHSPHKDKEKDKEKEKFRDKDSDKKNKDDKKRDDRKRERSKEHEERIKEKKEKRDKSPKPRSPTPTKRSTSPKRPPSPLPKYKDEKKIEMVPKERKSLDDKEKFEKKLKKEKRDKDKERKDNKHKDKEIQKSGEQKENKSIIREKEKHRDPSPLSISKIDKKEKSAKEKELPKENKEIEQIEKNGKIKTEKFEEKPKHKHKKKDKEKRAKDKSGDKEKLHKSEKKTDKNITSTGSKYTDTNKDTQKENEKASLFDSPKSNTLIENKVIEKQKKPLNALVAECIDSDSSNSSLSSRENLFNESVVKTEPSKKELLFEPQPIKANSEKKLKREKSKKNKEKRTEKDGEKKRKRKSDSSHIEEPSEKISKEDCSNSHLKDSDVEPNPPQVEMNEENYEDYMNLLRDLQHKILMLQDNSELQRVVQLIAETGRFEISAQTFDFDLCLLERSTIKQLQNFFASTS